MKIREISDVSVLISVLISILVHLSVTEYHQILIYIIQLTLIYYEDGVFSLKILLMCALPTYIDSPIKSRGFSLRMTLLSLYVSSFFSFKSSGSKKNIYNKQFSWIFLIFPSFGQLLDPKQALIIYFIYVKTSPKVWTWIFFNTDDYWYIRWTTAAAVCTVQIILSFTNALNLTPTFVIISLVME